ncbi:DUF4124 domain-containing protein [Pseudomonas sp. 10B1]|uniref:DUF4124 domain-containing protein n=1 Tax=unclassified Pseudomonas TaxID=196821 RepID=UPI002AB53539|nr:MULTISPECIES: DUF4124 domain-containing protein [unclassified Pseudomonas]MDY7562698.1 DUF4124 domain-containing protein [Pseudomonas sp. AB6]MEA9995898.1 DUF4124 domain-containing protein [Pseudomonas sp. AA4]MEB0087506.1 DUF4124 domain-containing protein [Pseudomonas sp. RTI1]MEB0127892.1 DUF4124 domain-containing protein [Pseudomonas sp. CCC1.2]MEB0154272.1 DUF4124 domain-containing protein [Pseudomonas sp. CCC4.3]
MSKLSVCGLVLAFYVVAGQAAEKPQILFYRYVDSKGGVVLDRQGVPTEYAGKGYQVLNERGRVMQVVPPAPTAAELVQQRADKAQADSDAQLLRLYSSVADVDNAKARKLAELDALVAVAQGNLQNLSAQQSNLQSQAADQERAGRVVPQSLVDQMKSLRDDQNNIKAEIVRYRDSRKQVDTSFAVDRVRVQKLVP